METFTRGQDLRVIWTLLYKNGEGFDPSDVTFELEYKTGRGVKTVDASSYSLLGNILIWNFAGEDQLVTGVYSLRLIARYAETGEEYTRFISTEPFNLAPSVFEVGDGTCEITSVCDKVKQSGGGGIVDCDAFLSLTSINPVQNKIVTAALKMIDVKITAVPSDYYIFNDATTNVTITASVSGLELNAEKIDIYKSDGSRVGGNTGSNSCSVVVPMQASGIYYAVVTALGGATKRSGNVSVTAVGHIYYGSGSSKSDFWSNKAAKANAVASPAGSYSVTIRNSGDVFYFAVPSTMSISMAKLDNLLNVPLKAADTTSYSGYKVYEGSNPMQAGTYSITLS